MVCVQSVCECVPSMNDWQRESNKKERKKSSKPSDFDKMFVCSFDKNIYKIVSVEEPIVKHFCAKGIFFKTPDDSCHGKHFCVWLSI